MTQDELEFSISRYLDGDLAIAERSALEARLERDPDARALLDEYRDIDANLKSMPLPGVRWDAFAAHVSAAVGELDEPVQSYKIGGGFGLRRWAAAAAAVIVGAGVAFLAMRPQGTNVERDTVVSADPPAQVIRIVNADAAPSPQTAAAPIVVAIGPSDRVRTTSTLRHYARDVISRPSQVLIASRARPVQDTAAGPF